MRRQNLTSASAIPTVVHRDPLVHIISVVCPECAAPIGVQCITSNGKRGRHGCRRRMAIRAAQEATHA